MSWLGFVLLILGIYLAFKVAGVVVQLLVWLLILVAGYWFLGPYLDWPSIPELIHVLGP